MANPIFSGCPGCIAAGLSTLLFGDPHLYGFEGERFDLHGEPNKYYNLLSDVNLQINALFGNWNNEPESTIIKKIGIKVGQPTSFNYIVMENDGLITFNGEKLSSRMVFDFDSNGYLAFAEPKTTFDGFNVDTPDIRHAGSFEGALLHLRLPAYEIQVLKSSEPLSDGSRGFFLNFLASILNKNVRPHGIIGQTADFDGKARESTGRQGEGVIEGIYTDYEVGSLMSDDFKYNKFA